MKKTLSIAFVSLFAAFLFAACSSETSEEKAASDAAAVMQKDGDKPMSDAEAMKKKAEEEAKKAEEEAKKNMPKL
ncbi:hypothetical protein N8787_04345 [Opitutaceae bacterium]|nr:hypothetical protein [Opitutaceae bacterium]